MTWTLRIHTGRLFGPLLAALFLGACGDGEQIDVEEPQTREVFVARYNGVKNGWDRASSIAIDSSGNSIVSGASMGVSTDYDYITIEYDPGGGKRWVAYYNGPGNDRDWANGVVVDVQGNVSVTGESFGKGTGDDYATVKYASDGRQLWVSRYDGPANDEDAAYSIATDSYGYSYVTGESRAAEGFDFATIKYGPNGEELWVARYDGPAHRGDGAYALAVDAGGNVYVTGYSWSDASLFDFLTVKYDPEGNERWVARYNGPGNGDDIPYGIATDEEGNVYVAGTSVGIGTGYDLATVKYDSQGEKVWIARYNGEDNGTDVIRGLALGPSGNVHVTGWQYRSAGECDVVTATYDADGNELWVASYDGPAHAQDEAVSLAVDGADHVIVAGYACTEFDASSMGCDNYESVTLKYDSDGRLLWEATYDGPAGNYDDAVAVAVDSSGYAHVAGESEGIDSHFDFFAVKYRP